MTDDTHGEKVTTRKELEAHIAAKARKDPKYRERLMANATAVVKEEIHEADPSITLPANFSVHVHDESSGVYHIVLPRDPLTSTDAGHHHEGGTPQTVGSLRMG